MQELGLHKTGARWVPRALSEDHKVQRKVIALSFLQQYAIHDHIFLKCIVTGDDVVSPITPQRQTVQEWSGNIPDPCDQKISRWANLVAE
jgi:hypothetical protein